MSDTSATPAEVRHDSQQQAFSLTRDGADVVLSYRRPDPQSIDFYSTFTPPPLRGRGLARVVVDAGLHYAREHGLRIIPTCSYVAKVLERES